MATFKALEIAEAIAAIVPAPYQDPRVAVAERAELVRSIERIIRQQCGDSCLAKVDSDEPIFVLRAQDVDAARVIRSWADRLDLAPRDALGQHAPGRQRKIDEARLIAVVMEAWPIRKVAD